MVSTLETLAITEAAPAAEMFRVSVPPLPSMVSSELNVELELEIVSLSAVPTTESVLDVSVKDEPVTEAVLREEIAELTASAEAGVVPVTVSRMTYLQR